MSHQPPRPPKDFQDPTFTPLREDNGSFRKVPEPPEQIKKDFRDPDWDKLNPDIIQLCQRNGMARGCLNLYLTGQLDWMEALESMVIILGKELLVNQSIQVETKDEYTRLWNQVNGQKLISDTLEIPEEQAHEAFFQ